MMGARCMANSAELPERDRSTLYRQMAAEAEEAAALHTGDLRQSYLLMARHWQHLAESADRGARNDTGTRLRS
jgi:hypothetical protein